VIELRSRWVWLTLFFLSLAGCEKPPALPASVDTGAEAAARTFFEALMREEWSTAYDTIDIECRTRWSRDAFAARARAAMSRMGFLATEVGVVVSETGDRASAVAVFRGLSGTTAKQFKDGVALKRTARGWNVIPRSNFGIAAAPAAKPGQGGKR
jgi:hypothetical protein